MSEIHMDVFLLNTPQPGVDQRTLSQKLAAAFKKDVATIDKMLGQPRTRIKKDVEQALANKYKTIIEAAGGQCELVSRELLPAMASPEASPALPPAQIIDESPQFCAKCGAPGQPGARKCLACFAPPLPGSAKSRLLGRLPALFAGGLGVRHFYPVFFVLLIGILAAIALPAYQDYTRRAKVQSAMPLVNSARDQVAKFIKKTGRFPAGNSAAGLPEAISSEVISSIILQEGAKLEVTFNFPSLDNGSNTLVWLPARKGEEITWSCTGGTLPDSYRIEECRGGTNQSEDKNADRLSERMFSDDQRVSIDLPQGWKTHSRLSDDASISAAHVSGATYALVIQESKSDFDEGLTLAEYTRLIVSLMKENMQDGHTPADLLHLEINGLPAGQVVLMGSVEGVKVGYLLTTIESEQGFYQVLTWTLASRLKQQDTLLRNIGKSFIVHQAAH